MKTISNEYFIGNKIFGDDLDLNGIKEWYKSEEEGYSSLIKNDNNYEYHNFNVYFGYKYLPSDIIFENSLGIGSAYGFEFIPIIEKIQRITILEPSSTLVSKKIGKITPLYRKPNIDGTISFEDNSFDLITSFGTLHHIPNVSYVLSELYRVLKPGGVMLIREPISTMGDWRKNRPGLTKNERGLPHFYFDKEFKKLNLKIIKKSFCESMYLYKILAKIFNLNKNKVYYKLDKYFSKFMSWNIIYHRTKFYQKIAPGSVFYVLKK
jgi:SAM-dependent methyltransferase